MSVGLDYEEGKKTTKGKIDVMWRKIKLPQAEKELKITVFKFMKKVVL